MPKIKIKSFKALAVELARREGKKKQVDIAQMRETLSHLADILFESLDEKEPELYESDLINVLCYLGESRANKKQ